jgi:hypothetical protein
MRFFKCSNTAAIAPSNFLFGNSQSTHNPIRTSISQTLVCRWD